MNHRPGVSKRNRLNPPPIYDGPHVFRVRSGRSHSEGHSNRDEDSSDGANRATPRCNWPDFLKKKIRFGKSTFRLSQRMTLRSAIHSPYALCNLPAKEQRQEDRPAFVNYGGYYQTQHLGDKRTYNSLSIHVSRSESEPVRRCAFVLANETSSSECPTTSSSSGAVTLFL